MNARQETRKKKGISNCSLCALGHDNNKTKIWQLSEMDADHITAWSKSGATYIKNCQMLCKSHNRAKGSKRVPILLFKTPLGLKCTASDFSASP